MIPRKAMVSFFSSSLLIFITTTNITPICAFNSISNARATSTFLWTTATTTSTVTSTSTAFNQIRMAASKSETVNTMQMKSDFAVVGCGVLGTSLCRQLIKSPVFGSRIVTGITKTTNRHEQILSEIFQQDDESKNSSSSSQVQLQTSDEAYTNAEKTQKRFKDVVFCAPPSGFEDYPGAVEDAITKLWEGPSGGGSFVFTSSGGVYEGKNGETITETSPVCDPSKNPRSARILKAEEHCIKHDGIVLRLSGLYTLDRGAHNYWLEKVKPDDNDGSIKVNGRADGIVNLLHYDDAANAAMTAVLFDDDDDDDDMKGKIFLVSDGNPTTRKGICESALKATRYKGKQMPTFLGGSGDDLGKVYDAKWTNKVLGWKPIFANSFDEFMAAHGEE